MLGITSLIALARSRWVEQKLNIIISWGLRKWTRLEVRDYISVLQLQNGYAVTEMCIESGDWLENKTLAAAELTKEGILVLGIQRLDGHFEGTPQAGDTIRHGDTLILYGLSTSVEELDQRRAGESGDNIHSQAIEAHQRNIRNTR